MYYFWSNGQQVGPYSLAQAGELLRGGLITTESLYWKEGMTEWQAVIRIVHLLDQARQSRPVYSPRPNPAPAGAVSSQTVSLDSLAPLLLSAIFVLAIIAFFLPNLSVEIPILGRMDLSMLDLLTPSGSEENASAPPDLRAMPKPDVKPNAWNLIKENNEDMGRADVGTLVCAISFLGLVVFYILTIAWGIYAFGLKRSYPRLNAVRLILAIQYPILLSISAQLIKSGLRSKMSSDLGGNPFAALGQAMVNHFSLSPGVVNWVLMALGLMVLVLPQLTRKPA
jgi:hypothetical protein